MKKLLVASLLFIIASCNSSNDIKVTSGTPALIREGFIEKDKYEVLCYGFPQKGLTGIAKRQSSQRAAILNAYYYIKVKFNDSVLPDRDGRVIKMTDTDDYAIVHYVIKKRNLKSRLLKR